MSDWMIEVVQWEKVEIPNRETGGGPNPKRPVFDQRPLLFRITCPRGHTQTTTGVRVHGGWEFRCESCGAVEHRPDGAFQPPT
jgi:hypothetical protein